MMSAVRVLRFINLLPFSSNLSPMATLLKAFDILMVLLFVLLYASLIAYLFMILFLVSLLNCALSAGSTLKMHIIGH